MNCLPKTVTRQRHGCDLNPGPSAPESSTLTTRLPSHRVRTDVVAVATGCWMTRAVLMDGDSGPLSTAPPVSRRKNRYVTSVAAISTLHSATRREINERSLPRRAAPRRLHTLQPTGLAAMPDHHRPTQSTRVCTHAEWAFCTLPRTSAPLVIGFWSYRVRSVFLLTLTLGGRNSLPSFSLPSLPPSVSR